MSLMKKLFTLSFIFISFKIIIRNNNFSKHAEMLSFNNIRYVNSNKKQGIFIVTPGRSGSTFLGELFRNHPHVLYHYEPLYSQLLVHKHSSELNIQMIEYLDGIFTCKLQKNHEIYLNQAKSASHRLLSKFDATVARCTHRMMCKYKFVSSNDLNKVCKNKFSHIVVKELQGRFPQQLEGILAKLKVQNIKVIQLVRDPRGMFLSMAKQGWINNEQTVNWDKVGERCETILTDYNYARLHIQSYKLIRYEDLCENILNQSEELLKFAGLNYTKEYKAYILTLESKKEENRQSSGAFGTDKNIKKTYQRWRGEISLSFLKGIEKMCSDLMITFGYNKIGNNISALLNIKISLHNRDFE